MDQASFQQACGRSVPFFSQQSDLVAQHDDDQEVLTLAFVDGHRQIATHVPIHAVPPFDRQLHSTLERQSGLVHDPTAGYAASSSFEPPPCADLAPPYHFPAIEQAFHPELPLWPQLYPVAGLNPDLVPSGDTNYDSFPGCETAFTTLGSLASQRPTDSHLNPRKNSRRCVRCWALRKPVYLIILLQPD